MNGAIIWGEYQEMHITERHEVSQAEVAQVIGSARTRVRRVAEEDDNPGTRFVLIGRTRRRRRLVVVVTLQLDGDLFPVTAFEETEGDRDAE